MLLLLAIFIKLSPRCPDGVGSRLKLVRHVAGHCPLGPTLLLLLLLLLPLLLKNLWQTGWGNSSLYFQPCIIVLLLLLVATRNPDYQSEIVMDKFDLFVTRQHVKGLSVVLTCAFTGKICWQVDQWSDVCTEAGDGIWSVRKRSVVATPPDVQIRPILLLQSALFLSPVKVAAVLDGLISQICPIQFGNLGRKKTHLLVFWRVISNQKNASLEHSNRSFQNG